MQFVELARALPSAAAAVALFSGAAMAIPLSVFCAFIILWAMTSYSISTERASASIFPLRIVSVHLDYVGTLKIERGLLDRLLGTNRVSFVSRHGKLLQQWNYVRLDRGKMSLLRKFALLIASVRNDRASDHP